MGDWGIGWKIGGGHSSHIERTTHACVGKHSRSHIHLLDWSTRLISGMRLCSRGRVREKKEKCGGVREAEVDLSAPWSHPVVTMGHPLLR